jgi:hypothetical protein
MKYSLLSLQTLSQGKQPVAPMWHDCGRNSFSSYNASTETIVARGEIMVGVQEGSGYA